MIDKSEGNLENSESFANIEKAVEIPNFDSSVISDTAVEYPE